MNELVSSIDRTKLVTVEQLTDDIVAYRSQVLLLRHSNTSIHWLNGCYIRETVYINAHTCTCGRSKPYGAVLLYMCSALMTQSYGLVWMRLCCVLVCRCRSLYVCYCFRQCVDWGNEKTIDRYDFDSNAWNFVR